MKVQFKCEEVYGFDHLEIDELPEGICRCNDCGRDVREDDHFDDWCVDCWVKFFLDNPEEFISSVAQGDFDKWPVYKKAGDRVLAWYRGFCQSAA